MKVPKILFFVDGMAPTAVDVEAASEINAHVVFRNARAVPADGSLEACDGVAGKVPAPYSKLPTAAQAIKTHAVKVREMNATANNDAAGKPVKPNPAPADKGRAPAQAGKDDVPKDEGQSTPPPTDLDAAKAAAPGHAPEGATGAAWKSNN